MNDDPQKSRHPDRHDYRDQQQQHMQFVQHSQYSNTLTRTPTQIGNSSLHRNPLHPPQQQQQQQNQLPQPRQQHQEQHQQHQSRQQQERSQSFSSTANATTAANSSSVTSISCTKGSTGTNSNNCTKTGKRTTVFPPPPPLYGPTAGCVGNSTQYSQGPAGTAQSSLTVTSSTMPSTSITSPTKTPSSTSNIIAVGGMDSHSSSNASGMIEAATTGLGHSLPSGMAGTGKFGMNFKSLKTATLDGFVRIKDLQSSASSSSSTSAVAAPFFYHFSSFPKRQRSFHGLHQPFQPYQLLHNQYHHPYRPTSKSSTSSSSPQWTVQVPKRMVFYTMSIFLVLPVGIFVWKESLIFNASHNHLSEISSSEGKTDHNKNTFGKNRRQQRHQRGKYYPPTWIDEMQNHQQDQEHQQQNESPTRNAEAEDSLTLNSLPLSSSTTTEDSKMLIRNQNLTHSSAQDNDNRFETIDRNINLPNPQLHNNASSYNSSIDESNNPKLATQETYFRSIRTKDNDAYTNTTTYPLTNSMNETSETIAQNNNIASGSYKSIPSDQVYFHENPTEVFKSPSLNNVDNQHLRKTDTVDDSDESATVTDRSSLVLKSLVTNHDSSTNTQNDAFEIGNQHNNKVLDAEIT